MSRSRRRGCAPRYAPPRFGEAAPVGKVEAALRRLEPIRVEAGAVIVRQRDRADRFYVIGRGAFEVSVLEEAIGANRWVRTMGRDDVFGERGLIAQTPRTATVTATGPGLLFTMDGPAFLRLVTRRRDMADRFLGLYGTPVAQPAPVPQNPG